MWQVEGLCGSSSGRMPGAGWTRSWEEEGWGEGGEGRREVAEGEEGKTSGQGWMEKETGIE